MASGETENRAVALADQAVIDAQGSGHIKDLSHLQRGTPTMKLFTQFMGYFSVVYNQGAEALGRTRWKDPAKVARLGVDLLMLYTVPMVLEQVIRDAVQGDRDDEDEVLREWIRHQAAYLLNTVVIAREFSGGVEGFDYKGPAGAGVFAEGVRTFKQIEPLIAYRLGLTDKPSEFDEKDAAALNALAGILFHYPATQVERLVRFAIEAEEQGALETWRVLFGGKPEK
jgi:hypothetical protein